MRNDWPLVRPQRSQRGSPATLARTSTGLQTTRSARTRQRLIDAGRFLIARNGFADTSTPDIVRRAGVTRGALYHHFADKQELFAAVYEDVERTMATRLIACWAANEARPYAERLRCAIRTYFELAADPAAHRILMVEAPAVLGIRFTDATATSTCRMLLQSLEGAQREGLLDPAVDVPAAAHLLFGSFAEAAQWISGTRDTEDAAARATAVADRFLDAFGLSVVP